MIDQTEAIDVLDWLLASACRQVTSERFPRAHLDDVLAAHFAWLRTRAPITHVALCALLASEAASAPSSDNLALRRLAGAPEFR